MRSVVVLPAPFGPSRPVISPSRATKLTSSTARIARPRAVTVRFLNEKGEVEERDFVHLWATSVQHQIDHLAGKMYFDLLSPLKRKMLIAKADKLRRRG